MELILSIIIAIKYNCVNFSYFSLVQEVFLYVQQINQGIRR